MASIFHIQTATYLVTMCRLTIPHKVLMLETKGGNCPDEYLLKLIRI